MQNGVPFEVLDLLMEHEIDAYYVTFQELSSGQRFNWEYMVWPEPGPDD